MKSFSAFLVIAMILIVARVSAQGLEFFDVDEYNKESKQKVVQSSLATSPKQTEPLQVSAPLNDDPKKDGDLSVKKTDSSSANAALAGAELDLTTNDNNSTAATTTNHEKKKKKKKNLNSNSTIPVAPSDGVEFLNEASTAVSLPSSKKDSGSSEVNTTTSASSSSSTNSGNSVDFLDLSIKKTNSSTQSTSSSMANTNAVQFMDLESNGTSTATTPGQEKPQVVLITGITGLMGSNVARELVKNKRYKVYGMIRQRSSLDLLSGIIQSVHLILGDITDSFRMLDVIQAVKPDIVYHFAAQSANALSFEHPQLTMSINVHGTLNLLEALRRADLTNTRIFFPSSSSAYGNSGKLYSNGIPEVAKLDPISPYGLSKATAEEIVLQYNRNYDMPVIVGRLFLYLGQGSTIMIDIQDFCRQIASIEAGIQANPIVRATSNLQAIRDISDVRDFAEVIVKLVEVGKAGEIYNIGSGIGSKTEDLLRSLIVQSNMTEKITATPSEKGASFKHERHMVANISKLIEATGYSPKHVLEETLRIELDHWRQTLKTLYNGFNPAQLNATFST